MIDLEALVAWFNAVNTDLAYTFVAGPRVPEFGNADVLGVVTPLEGPGLTLDGLASVASSTARPPSGGMTPSSTPIPTATPSSITAG